MAFKDNYKDEIATRRYQIVDNKTGAIVNPDVALKRIDTPTQKGDKFMAVDVNALCKRLNALENAVVTEENTTVVGSAIKFKNGLQMNAGANEILYQFVKGVGHANIHAGNIGECTAGNTFKLQGYAVLNRIAVFNPAGTNYVVIPCEGKTVHFATVINGNWAATNALPIGIASRTGELIVFFDKTFNANVQLNYQLFYPE